MTRAEPVTPFKLALTALYLLVWPALLMLLAGDWRWPTGWLFSAWFLATCLGSIVWLYRNDPELLAERYRRPGTGGQSRHDKWLVYFLGIGFLAWLVLMPLDGRRFHWTPSVPLPLRILGAALLVLGSLLMFRSLEDNPFASALVRVQSERGHHVVSSGVYRVVRHPMYLGATLMFLGGPLLVGASAALIPGLALVLLFVVRIHDEERVLSESLPGYDAYRARVRYRLIPRVW